jgi:hypothetical protein
MSLSPYEIRLQLLMMSKDLLLDEYHTKRDHAYRKWELNQENPQSRDYPDLAKFPSEQDIVAKAKSLNDFVSSAPPPLGSKKV